MLMTPPSLKEEHKEIMGLLREYSEIQGETGNAVKKLLDVLEPHFQKEEKLAMPVLGSLPELVSGNRLRNLSEIAESQGALLEEYDGMLEEHSELRKFIASTKEIARQEKHQEVIDLLDGLAHHARVEEEVLYPAALLAGTVAKFLIPVQEQKPMQGIA